MTVDDASRISDVSDNVRVVHTLFDEVLGGGRFDLADELVADDFRGAGFGAGMTGPDAIKTLARTLRGAFSELRFQLDDVVAAEDRVAVRWTMTGRHTGTFVGTAPTGNPVRQQAIVIYSVTNGKVRRLWTQVGDIDLDAKPEAADVTSPGPGTRA